MAGQSHFFGYYFVLSVIHASSCSQTMCYVPNRRVSKPGEVVLACYELHRNRPLANFLVLPSIDGEEYDLCALALLFGTASLAQVVLAPDRARRVLGGDASLDNRTHGPMTPEVRTEGILDGNAQDHRIRRPGRAAKHVSGIA